MKATLTTGPIGSVLLRLTIPMIFGMFSIVAFNISDTWFVSRLGTTELAALTFTFPVVLVLGAIGMGIGMGASAVISRAIGEGDRKRVKRLTVDSMVLAVVFALTFVSIGLLTVDPLFRAMGASGVTLDMVKDYMYIWYIGVTFVIVPFVGNSAIRADGDTRTPALIMGSMVLLNILLDPLLIFGLGPIPAMGLRGAAIATVIARSISLVLGLVVLHRRKMLTATIPNFNEALKSWKSILYVGLPAAATNLVVPMTIFLVTKLISTFGEEAVAAFGVASRLDLFAIMVVVALASVLGPFVGQNLGSGNIARLKKGVQLSQRFSLIWGIGMMAVLGLSATLIAPLFSEKKQVIDYIMLYLWIAPFGYATRCLYTIHNTILNVLNKPLLASAVTLLQMFVVYLPMAFIFSEIWGLGGIFASFALAYIFGGTLSYFLVNRTISNIETGTIAPIAN